MRRAPIVLAATIAGSAGVLAFNPQPRLGGSAVVEAPLPSISRASSADAIVLGPAVPNQYGTVQVQVARANGRIVEVRAVQLPNGDGKSAEISAYAGPLLKRQALVAQTAKLDGISGATYTSDGYRTSLQAALDRLGGPVVSGAPA